MEHYFTNNENLKSEFRKINYSYKDSSFTFTSDLGVFSKNKVDYGSKVLVETILNMNFTNKRILDVGCGYGFIGIVLSKITNSYVDMIDINKRAVHLSLMNIENNKVNASAFISDAYENIKETYDYIVINPPIRAGKQKVLEVLLNAKEHLNKNGILYYVIRKDQGAISISEKLKGIYNVELLKKDKGFYIYKATF